MTDSLDLADNLRYLTVPRRALKLDEVEAAMLRVGRNNGPVIALFASGALSPSDTGMIVSHAWEMAEFPQSALTQAEWRGLFAVAGYTVNGHQAERPLMPLTLYRGAHANYRRRWAWTDDLVTAEKFMARRSRDFADDGEGDYLWTAEVEPHRLLVAIGHDDPNSRGEREYVVDTRGLKIQAMRPHAIADLVRDNARVYPMCTDEVAQ